MHTDKGIDKQIVLSSYSGLLFSIKKGCTADTCNNMDRSQKHVEWKKWVTEESVLHVCTVWFHLWSPRTGITNLWE